MAFLPSHAPLKTFTNRGDRQPWVYLEYLESANERDNLQDKSQKTNSAIDKLIANRARNRTTELKRQLKRSYFQNAIQDAGGDSAKLWKAIKRLLQNCNTRGKITSINGKNQPG